MRPRVPRNVRHILHKLKRLPDETELNIIGYGQPNTTFNIACGDLRLTAGDLRRLLPLSKDPTP